MIPQPCRLPYQRPGGFDFRVHIREHPFNCLEVSDGLPKSPPFLRVAYRRFQCALCDTYALRGDAHAPAVERLKRNFETLPLFTQPVFHGYYAVGESNFSRARGAKAHFILVPADTETREPRFHQKS